MAKIFLVLIFPILIISSSDFVPNIARITEIGQLKALIKAKQSAIVYFHTDGAVLGDVLINVGKEIDKKTSIAFVYCKDLENSICEEMNSRPNPFELKIYVRNEFHSTYDGKFDKENILRYIKDSSIKKSPIKIKSEDEFIKCIGAGLPTLILYFRDDCDLCDEARRIWKKLPEEHKNWLFATVNAAKDENLPMTKVYKITEYPSIHYFIDGVHMWEYEGDVNYELIKEWMKAPEPKEVEEEEEQNVVEIKAQEAPWSSVSDANIDHLDSFTAADYLKEHDNILMIFHTPWCGPCRQFRPIFENVARRSKIEGHNFAFAAVDGTKNENLRRQFGIDGYPKVIYVKKGKKSLEIFDRIEEDIMAWIRGPERVPTKKISPDWSNTETDIFFVGEKNWEDDIETVAHAFVMFYAPWCAHCQNVKGEWSAATKQFAGRMSIRLAAVDCTREATLCQRQRVGAYPSFKYFRFGNLEETYRGPRGREHFIQFIAEKTVKMLNRDEL